MSTTTVTKAARVIIPIGTSNAANATLLGTPLDLRTSQGGLLTCKMTNSGALGAQAVLSVVVAHNDGASPTAALPGADWKTVYPVGNGIASGTTTEWSYRVYGAMHVNVVVTGNTTNAVVCEALMSETVNAVSA